MGTKDSDTVSPQAIAETSRAFMRSRVLLTAFELGIFTALAEDSKTSADIANSLRTDARATDRLMNALCALGFLVKRDGRFSNTPATARVLVKGKPDYMSGMMHTVHLWQTWGTLTEAVRRGTSVRPRGSDAIGDEYITAFIAAMHWRSRIQAPALASFLDLEGVHRVLDVGGGSGMFSMAMVRAKQGLKATIFDLPDVVPLTRQYIKQEGLSEYIDTVAGDFNEDELPTGCDLVFLSAIVHSISFERNVLLIRKCADAVNPNGRVVVQDHIMSDGRISPPEGALFALNMLVNTEGGDTYTESEIRSWMTQAGLIDITHTDTPYGSGLIIGRKAERK